MRRKPSFLERLLYTTVRIHGKDPDGSEVSGTAFFYNHRFVGEDHLFLVSNSHVVKELDDGTMVFHSRTGARPDPTGTVKVLVKEVWRGWEHHPDDLDLAVMPVSFLFNFLERTWNRIYVQSLDDGLVPSKREANASIDTLEDVYFIGYPNDIYDRVNQLPVVRKGTTATPFSNDFNGKPWFLLDGSIFPGSSGSPVLLIDQNGFIDRRNRFIPKRRVFFMGILRSGYVFKEEVSTRKGKEKAQKVRTVYNQMMDLGVVVRSDALHDMVEAYLVKNSEAQLRSVVNERMRDLFGLFK